MNGPHRQLLETWLILSIPPVSWLVAFAVFISLVNHGCPRLDLLSLFAVGIGGAALAAGIALLAYLRTYDPGNRAFRRSRLLLLRVAIGLGLMFALLIAVTTLPAAWLSACPS